MRHRIEHYPFRKNDSLKRTADLGIPVCTQPALVPLKADDFQEKLGPRARSMVDTMLPLRSFMKEGVQVCYGADVPAFPSHSPMESIRCAMDRVTKSGRTLADTESVLFLEALRHHTVGGAYAAHDEEELGSLEPGKYADFVIWNKDLRGIAKGSDALTLEPEETYLAGQIVYQKT
jgi:predicted amidohydrolase YtcJ